MADAGPPRDVPAAVFDPTAGFSDMQWFMFRQSNIVHYAAFSRRDYDQGALLEAARGLAALAPQLRTGFRGADTGRDLPDGLLERVVALGYPVLLGASRKAFIGALDGGKVPADQRLGGSIAVALAGAAAGVAAVRVHDVRETVQALRVWQAIEAARRG